ncbi:hypothetical protein BGZ65_007849 [Modicella reniformis]|uniref:Galactose oxidase n=1 Tax=Modicella reniformis TaxID=1440133 RepID=A0A9P6JK84_9FUNG|nr:hypothetical protein BGZ65_007849 [Modicella reniformis]
MTSHSTTTQSRKRLAFRLLSITVVLSTILSSSSPSCAHAQAPVGTRRMGFAVLYDTLYIQGGYDLNASSRFVSLDLSTSWSANSPPWKRLPDGQVTTHLALAPISAASNGGIKGSLLSIGGIDAASFFSSYDVNAGAWQAWSSVKNPFTYLEGHAAVSDPNTGLIYIIGGNGNSTYNQLTVYDPKSKTTVSQASATAATSLTDAGAVWLSERNTILTFGGSRAQPAAVEGLGDENLMEFDPSSKTWKTMTTSGDVPPARVDHCMAASDDGSTVVVFGGGANSNDFFNTIYILDVKSGKWKQGQAAPVPRTRMACAFHSYQFIAWGGSSGTPRSTMLDNLPIVYNLNSNKWTDNYDAAEKRRKSNIGTIVGAVLTIVVLCAVIAVLVIKKRQRRRAQDKAAYDSDAVTAAAISNREDGMHDLEDPNIKVAVENYNGGYGNEYPMHQLDGHHGHGEKVPSQYLHQNKYGKSSTAGTPVMKSPQALYHPQSQQDPNPFMSPEEFAPHSLHHHHGAGSQQQSPNPFMQATVAVVSKATPYHPISSRNDPFVRQYSPSSYSQTTTYIGQQSPAPGARSPQVIPETANDHDNNYHNDNNSRSSKMDYVPPPM